MDAVVSVTFNRYSFETMNLLRARVKRWENEVRTTRCKAALAIPDCDKFDVDLVELSFRTRQGRRRARLPGSRSDRVHAVRRADQPAAPRRSHCWWTSRRSCAYFSKNPRSRRAQDASRRRRHRHQ